MLSSILVAFLWTQAYLWKMVMDVATDFGDMYKVAMLFYMSFGWVSCVSCVWPRFD